VAGHRARGALQAILAVLGAVMVLAGASTVLLGATSIVGVDTPSPSADSEMRFYAVWYVIAGVFLLRALRTLETSTTTVRLVAVGFFAAGCARALSWLVVGRPSSVAVALMVVELVLPLVIVPWHAGIARRAPT
jgi:hypothetical protein